MVVCSHGDQGFMDMASIVGVYRSAPDLQAGIYPFAVVGRDATFQLACRDRHSADAWITALSNAIEAFRGPVHGPARDVSGVVRACVNVELW